MANENESDSGKKQAVSVIDSIKVVITAPEGADPTEIQAACERARSKFENKDFKAPSKPRAKKAA